MEKKPRPKPEKSVSFTCREEKKPQETIRNLSLGSIKAHFNEPNGPTGPNNGPNNPPEVSFLSLELDKFLSTPDFPLPQRASKELLDRVENELSNPKISFSSSFPEAVLKLSHLVTELNARKTRESILEPAECILQRAMGFLEDEFRALLDEPGPITQTETLTRVARTMVRAGFELECTQAYAAVRRGALQASISAVGFEILSMDEVYKMTWQALEEQISSWLIAFRHVATSLPLEKTLCETLFPAHLSGPIILNLFRGAADQLLTFAEAVAMTSRSAEKLFKLLDMYECLRQLRGHVDGLGEDGWDLRGDVEGATWRIGEAAVSIFAELENRIREDSGKIPVPGGAVHPLTRYVMNYLKYACEYKTPLEELLRKNEIRDTGSDPKEDPNSGPGLFAGRLIGAMDMLDTNLEGKAKLYKDTSLGYIFLMNNGRYILQKIKGAKEVHDLLGDKYCRRKSTNLRQYHKTYQRETWGKLLGCFKEEGLQTKGVIQKPVLKERFRMFNAMFEEIHKTQSCWVVSDEQLQSELRVSICSVIVPAYRSFLGRYQQCLDAGRQSDKYIKFSTEDLETFIDDLFDGTPASTAKRRS